MFADQKKDTYLYNNILNNTNLNPHHSTDDKRDDVHILDVKRSDTMSDHKKCCSVKPTLKPIPPHITICPPDEQDVIGFDFLQDDDVDNDVFQSAEKATPLSPSQSQSEEKHKVHSGRLYLICHTGNNYVLSPPSRSPVTSPTQSPIMPFHFRASSPHSSQQCASPISSPSSSPTPPSTLKVSVFVRVYRCNSEHFAIITRDPIYTSKPTYINMRHSRVIPGHCLGRFIVAGHCDSGNVIEFEVPELSSLEQWLDAFQVYTTAVSPSRTLSGSSSGSGSGGMVSPNTPPIPRSPVLPTLAETDEDD
ncbi:unnamed protein product [Candidula unifasciata]|uniref:Uncharacterized protein n=1 Tax=Candidula unifasciata TaxID=100452 RepID=A0A8S3YJE9_9EUPU|nr:unnamed protein product [Candidula unifasciata]